MRAGAKVAKSKHLSIILIVPRVCLAELIQYVWDYQGGRCL